MPTLEDLGQKVKAKYPGQYDDLPDADLGAKVKAKFPGAYDDFTPSTPKPAEKPGVMERAISNLPSSAANAILHPTFPGMPTDTEIPAGQNLRDVFEKNQQETIQGLKDLWKHPIDTVVNYVKEKFATDPVGTSLAVAAMSKPAIEGTPIAESLSKAGNAVASIPGKVSEVAKTPGTMTIAKGGAQGVAGAGAILEGHPYIGGGLLARGWQNVVKGMQERRAAQNAPPPLLDDLAQSLAGKTFDKLTPDAQAQIRQISENVREPVRKMPAPPVTEGGRINTGPSTTPGKTLAQMLQDEIDARKARNAPPAVDRPLPVWQRPNIQPADIPQGPTDPTVAPQPRPIAAAQELPAAPPERVPLWKGLPKPSEEKFGPPEGPLPRPQLPSGRRPPGQPAPETPQDAAQQFEGAYQIPDAERTGQVKPAPKESYQRAARTVKARALARWLRIGGISLEDAQSMNAEQWGMAADGAGVNVPSPDSVKLALGELEKLYKAKGAVKIDEALKRGNQAEAHFYMDKAAKEPAE